MLLELKNGEVFKPINGLYHISNFGRVYSNTISGFMRFGINISGYKTYKLRIDGRRTNLFEHKLIAQYFIPNPDNKPQINHINGIKTDNRIENLEWCTASENLLHAYKLGFKKPYKSKRQLEQAIHGIY